MPESATTNNDDAAAVSQPATAPPRAREVRRRHRARLDRNRPFEILAVLLIYVLLVHYALKFASFFLPDDDEVPSREEMLGMRGAMTRGVALGFTLGGTSSFRAGGTTSFGGGRISSSFSSHHRIRRGSCITAHPPLRNNDSAAKNTNDTDTEVSILSSHDDSSQTIKPTHGPHKRPRIPILSYRDDHVIVSKPPGMTMHHNSHSRWGRSKSPVLQTAIHKQLSRKPYLVHRLDHRTSGACIMGFDSRTASELHGRLRREDAVKVYVALVRGDLREDFRRAAAAGKNEVDMSDEEGDGSIVGSHGEMPDIMTTTKGMAEPHLRVEDTCCGEYKGIITVNLPIKVDGIEKEARTDFHFLSSMDDPDADVDEGKDGILGTKHSLTPRLTKSLTLLLCRPRTGRTHQIRRHVRKAFDAPVIGDSEHGDSRVNRYWRTQIGFDRLGLHCWYLGLPSSFSKEEVIREEEEEGDDDDDGIACIAPLTEDFADALRHERLRPLWEEATRIEPRLTMEPYDERGGTFGRNYRTRQTIQSA